MAVLGTTYVRWCTTLCYYVPTAAMHFAPSALQPYQVPERRLYAYKPVKVCGIHPCPAIQWQAYNSPLLAPISTIHSAPTTLLWPSAVLQP